MPAAPPPPIPAAPPVPIVDDFQPIEVWPDAVPADSVPIPLRATATPLPTRASARFGSRSFRLLGGRYAVRRRLAFTADLHLVATENVSSEIVSLDVPSGRILARYRGHPRDYDDSIAMSPNGRLVVFAADHGARVQSTTSGKLVTEVLSAAYPPHRSLQGDVFYGPGCRNTCSAFAPDGRRFVQVFGADILATGPPEVAIYDATSGKRLGLLAGARCDGTDIAWSSVGDKIACTTRDGVEVWKPAGGRAGGLLPRAEAIAFASDGKTIALVASGYASIVALANGEQLARVAVVPNRTALAAALSPDGSYVAVSTADVTRVFDVTSGKMLPVPPGHDGAVMHLALSPDGNTMVSSGDDGAVLAWDVASRALVRVIERRAAETAPDIAISPDGKTLAVARSEHRTRNEVDFRRYDLASGRFAAPTVRLTPLTDATTTRVAYAPDGRLFAGAAGFVWRVRDDGAGVDIIATGLVGPMLAFPDNDSVIAGSPMTRLQLSFIDLRTPHVERTIVLGDSVDVLAGGSVAAITLVANRAQVALTATDEPGVYIVERASGKVVGCLPGWAFAIASSPTTQYIVTAGGRSTLSVFDARTLAQPTSITLPQGGRAITCAASISATELAGHDAGVNDVRIAPDGSFVVSASDDGTLLLWRMP